MPSPARPAPGGVTVVIPARGGSKGLPGKNLAHVGEASLVARAVKAALGAKTVDLVAVSTDHAGIAEAAKAAGAQVVARPAELSDDEATSEAAVAHALAQLGVPKVAVMVQATSPFTRPADIDAVVGPVLDGQADTAFTASPHHGFIWRATPAGAEGVNHDPAKPRARRQDLAPEFLETGAAYAMDGAGFLACGRRFFGRVQAVPTDPERTLEVDTAADLARARALAPLLDGQGQGDATASGAVDGLTGPAAKGDGSAQAGHTASGMPTRDQVDAVVTDFDGVHTDNTVWVDQDGREAVQVSRADGFGVAQLVRAGVKVAILSAETNPVVARRAAKLGVACRQGVADKAAGLAGLCHDLGVDPEKTIYVGNDLGDLPAMRLAGWPVAVADACPDVLAQARLATRAKGGQGAIREIADWLTRGGPSQ